MSAAPVEDAPAAPTPGGADGDDEDFGAFDVAPEDATAAAPAA